MSFESPNHASQSNFTSRVVVLDLPYPYVPASAGMTQTGSLTAPVGIPLEALTGGVSSAPVAEIRALNDPDRVQSLLVVVVTSFYQLP